MKIIRLILVFLAFAGVTSCSSDDDGNNNGPAQNDPIIGKWKMQSTSLDGEELEITDCQAQSTIEFLANGNVTSIDFYEDFDTEECVSESSTQKWQNRGNNVYRISEGNQSTDIKVVFSNNNNTFTISEENEDGSYSITFVRV